MSTEIEKKCIDAIRFLSIDMVQKANSGHPGAPMSLAPLAFTLWKDHLNFNPDDPEWVNRDRFILSAGHASALLYSMLHLTGYDLTIDDLKNFRQYGSKTPGHPENTITRWSGSDNWTPWPRIFKWCWDGNCCKKTQHL